MLSTGRNGEHRAEKKLGARDCHDPYLRKRPCRAVWCGRAIGTFVRVRSPRRAARAGAVPGLRAGARGVAGP
jgi:hypothetical protein